jgi:hypothetical protein
MYINYIIGIVILCGLTKYEIKENNKNSNLYLHCFMLEIMWFKFFADICKALSKPVFMSSWSNKSVDKGLKDLFIKMRRLLNMSFSLWFNESYETRWLSFIELKTGILKGFLCLETQSSHGIIPVYV